MNVAKNSKQIVLTWEIVGFFFINISGSLLHFIFEWSGRWRAIAFFAAVNESTWEHLKLAFWPALIFALFEYRAIKTNVHNFIIAKTLSVYVMILSIIILFYTYLGIIGHDILILDITIFVIAVGIGQLISYKLLTGDKFTQSTNTHSLLFLILLIAAFLLLTYFPPRMIFFKDPITGSYGIIDVPGP